MGVSIGSVYGMQRYGMLAHGKKLLDFGSSNLYGATVNDVLTFVRKHNPAPRRDLETWAEAFVAKGSSNGAFLGELLEAAGMGYDAIDIAIGYKTTVVDLNSMPLPRKMVGAYDTVINYGTSEHIINQMNVFATMHAATKAGGYMMHSVPGTGFLNHGYFIYTGRFFFDLAGHNQYEVVDMWYDYPPNSAENLYESLRQYASYFPALGERVAQIGKSERETLIDQLKVPTIGLSVIYRKVKDIPFMGTIETSTSVGLVPDKVLGAYN
jgi:hypothetical protein